VNVEKDQGWFVGVVKRALAEHLIDADGLDFRIGLLRDWTNRPSWCKLGEYAGEDTAAFDDVAIR